jgi:hypothetical protein
VSTHGSGELSPHTAADLQQLAPRIREGLKRAITDLVSVGSDLITAKSLLPHGDWMPWLAMEFDLSVSTAENFMRVARLAEQLGAGFADVANLPAAALYELAAPSTPAQIVEQVASGSLSPTLQAIREAKAAARTSRANDRGRLAARLGRSVAESLDLSVEEIADGLAGRAGSDEVRAFAEALAEAADLVARWEADADEMDEGVSPLAAFAPVVGAVFDAIRARHAARGAE